VRVRGGVEACDGGEVGGVGGGGGSPPYRVGGRREAGDVGVVGVRGWGRGVCGGEVLGSTYGEGLLMGCGHFGETMIVGGVQS